jgi:hypothetical protein
MVKGTRNCPFFFYPDIYNKLYSMIKQTWEISNEEKNRILSLHESATKNLYLMSEQNTDEIETGSKSLTDRVEFPSGLHSASSVNLTNLIDLSEIEEFLKKYDDKKIIIKLKSSESQVPNYDREVEPKKKLNPGDLSKLRYETIRTFMTNWLNGLISKGIITTMPEFVNTEPQIDTTTPWNPSPGLTSSQISALAKDPKYTKHQFVEIEVDATGENIIKRKTVFTPEFSKVVTARTKGSAKSQYNAALFYNYSYAPAAVLGMSQSQAESLPGALLTMNRYFQVTTPIEKLNLQPFTMNIIPNGGQEVPVIVLNYVSKFRNGLMVNPQWSKWNAFVSDSYTLEIPFASDSKEFQSAWLFIYWYIKKGFPQDWKFIANKPENVDWNLIDLEQLQSSGEQIQNTSIEKQKEVWTNYPMDWYAKEVKKVY